MRIYKLLQALKTQWILSSAQFTRGTIDIPAYRATYLDQLSKTSILDIQAEENFRRLIRNMKDIEDIEYTIPQEIEPILRPYQKKRFPLALCTQRKSSRRITCRWNGSR